MVARQASEVHSNDLVGHLGLPISLGMKGH